MSVKKKQALGILARPGAHPAISFYEAGVASTIKAILDELKQRCRRALQARADALMMAATQSLLQAVHVDSTLALV